MVLALPLEPIHQTHFMDRTQCAIARQLEPAEAARAGRAWRVRRISA
jgi:hypothetical protein